MAELETRVAKTKNKQTILLNENEFYDRQGNLCTRVKPTVGNKYDPPLDIFETEDEFSFQWIRYSCKGNLNMNELSIMQFAGWAPSTPEVFNGYYKEMIAPGENRIIIDGQILMERPKHITSLAIRETENKAYHELARQTDNINPEDQHDLPSGVKALKRDIDMGRFEKVKVKRTTKPKQELNFSIDG